MGKFRVLALAVLAAAVMGGPACAADRTAAGKATLTMLVKRDFAGVVKNFDDTMKKALPAGKLQEAWDAVNTQAGPFQRQLGARQEQAEEGGQKYDVVIVTCQFQKAKVDAKVVYNTAGKIAGLFFMPSQ